MEKADVYICDNSSTIFEWCMTEKPIVLLTPPFYRREVTHKGNPRFWKHAGIAPDCTNPFDLSECVKSAIRDRDIYLPKIQEAKRDVLTITDGTATAKAVEIIKKYIHD
jgi:CDP-glycerol glycerophosphotransferase (TagB/SpsB family)